MIVTRKSGEREKDIGVPRSQPIPVVVAGVDIQLLIVEYWSHFKHRWKRRRVVFEPGKVEIKWRRRQIGAWRSPGSGDPFGWRRQVEFSGGLSKWENPRSDARWSPRRITSTKTRMSQDEYGLGGPFLERVWSIIKWSEEKFLSPVATGRGRELERVESESGLP